MLFQLRNADTVREAIARTRRGDQLGKCSGGWCDHGGRRFALEWGEDGKPCLSVGPR